MYTMYLMTIIIITMTIISVVCCQEINEKSQIIHSHTTIWNPYRKKTLHHQNKHFRKTDSSPQLNNRLYLRQVKHFLRNSKTRQENFIKTDRSIREEMKYFNVYLALIFVCSLLTVLICAILFYFIFYRKRNSISKENRRDIEEETVRLLSQYEEEIGNDNNMRKFNTSAHDSSENSGQITPITNLIENSIIVEDPEVTISSHSWTENQNADSNKNHVSQSTENTERLINDIESKLREMENLLNHLKNQIKITSSINQEMNVSDQSLRSAHNAEQDEHGVQDENLRDSSNSLTSEIVNLPGADDSCKKNFQEQIANYYSEDESHAMEIASTTELCRILNQVDEDISSEFDF
ncbi:uncharacterized protein LOC111627693 [Centruroides sculpturatus]|uniref:uncharacterized protein LOC111627693 n=1 Tax=Centruroides sculpturatus TaxID=218467 RepID=UPI000C6E0AE5|nr:uncharacterized protein LOC111627693 [Centruroides sculpturatus]